MRAEVAAHAGPIVTVLLIHNRSAALVDPVHLTPPQFGHKIVESTPISTGCSTQTRHTATAQSQHSYSHRQSARIIERSGTVEVALLNEQRQTGKKRRKLVLIDVAAFVPRPHPSPNHPTTQPSNHPTTQPRGKVGRIDVEALYHTHTYHPPPKHPSTHHPTTYPPTTQAPTTPPLNHPTTGLGGTLPTCMRGVGCWVFSRSTPGG